MMMKTDARRNVGVRLLERQQETMGTTESLPSSSHTEEEGDEGDYGDSERPNHGPSRRPIAPVGAPPRRRRQLAGHETASSSPTTRPEPRRGGVGSSPLPSPASIGSSTAAQSTSNQKASSLPATSSKRSSVISCTLTCLVMGRDGSGKRTLLQRLQGKDPFLAEDRSKQQQSTVGNGQIRQDDETAAVVTVPYHTTHPVLHDRITLAVRTMPIDDNPREKRENGDAAAVDFAVLLLHPNRTDEPQAHVKECVHQFLRLQGYKPNQHESEVSEEEEAGTGTTDDGGNGEDPPQSRRRPVCLCLLINFRDLKPNKRKSKSKKKGQQQSAGDDERSASAAESSSWLSRSTVQQWVLEALQGFDQSLDSSQLVLQLGHTSLYNCYGLTMLHNFVYQSYLVRQQHDAMRRLLFVQSLLRNVPSLQDNAESSYEAFLESTNDRARPRDDDAQPSPSPTSLTQQHEAATKQQQHQPQREVDLSAPPLQRNGPPRRHVVLPEHRRRSAAQSKQEDETAASATAPIPDPTPSRADPVEASRAALEAFLMEDDSENDDRKASQSRNGQMGDGAATDDDDDDDFFVDEVPAPTSSTKPSPKVGDTHPDSVSRESGGPMEQGSGDASRVRATDIVGASPAGSEEAEVSHPSGTSPSSASVVSEEREVELVKPTNNAPSPSHADSELNSPTKSSADGADEPDVDDSTSNTAGAKRSAHETGDPDQDVTVAEAVEGCAPQSPSLALDHSSTNGSTVPLPPANGNRHESNETEILQSSRRYTPVDPEHNDDNDDDDDDAFIIQDTITRYSPSKATEHRGLSRSEPSTTSSQSDAPSSTLSAAALAAIAEAQLEAELMHSRQDSQAAGATRKKKPKKEKKVKKEKKGSRKDELDS